MRLSWIVAKREDPWSEIQALDELHSQSLIHTI